jgi:hypothetical protein
VGADLPGAVEERDHGTLCRSATCCYVPVLASGTSSYSRLEVLTSFVEQESLNLRPIQANSLGEDLPSRTAAVPEVQKDATTDKQAAHATPADTAANKVP